MCTFADYTALQTSSPSMMVAMRLACAWDLHLLREMNQLFIVLASISEVLFDYFVFSP
jgi:hypothetical protein